MLEFISNHASVAVSVDQSVFDYVWTHFHQSSFSLRYLECLLSMLLDLSYVSWVCILHFTHSHAGYWLCVNAGASAYHLPLHQHIWISSCSCRVSPADSPPHSNLWNNTFSLLQARKWVRYAWFQLFWDEETACCSCMIGHPSWCALSAPQCVTTVWVNDLGSQS